MLTTDMMLVMAVIAAAVFLFVVEWVTGLTWLRSS